MIWQCGRFDLDMNKPQVMGIVNMTPDSFSDGGSYSLDIVSALKHAEKLLEEGADILDIGGESSRPGANYVSPEEEINRVLPILKEVKSWNIPITLDTRRTIVMQKILEDDLVDAINDIEALQDEGAIDLLAQYPRVGICLMHMQGQPENMQNQPAYQDVVEEVCIFLQQRIHRCLGAGIQKERLLLDPGIGFGKTLTHNLELLRQIPIWKARLGLPILIGLSRKTMLGQITGESVPKERLGAGISAAIESIRLGADIIRTHDVKATKQAIQVYSAFHL